MEFTSSVAKWPGRIVTGEYITYPELVEFEAALDMAKGLGENSRAHAFYQSLLPAACKIVRKWEIQGLPENVTPDNFPGSLELVAWVVESISDLYKITNGQDPKSPEQSTTM